MEGEVRSPSCPSLPRLENTEKKIISSGENWNIFTTNISRYGVLLSISHRCKQCTMTDLCFSPPTYICGNETFDIPHWSQSGH